MIAEAKFLTALQVEQLDERRWKTLSTLSYQSVIANALIDTPTDFISDFASTPRTPLAWWLAGGIGNKAATIHDWLYSRHEILMTPITKVLADKIFLEALGTLGIASWRRYPMYWAVRIFGGRPWSTGPARFAALNPIWAAQEMVLGPGQFVPARDVRIPGADDPV